MLSAKDNLTEGNFSIILIIESGGMEAAGEIWYDVPDEKMKYHEERNKGLLGGETIQIVKNRYATAKKDGAASTISETLINTPNKKLFGELKMRLFGWCTT